MNSNYRREFYTEIPASAGKDYLHYGRYRYHNIQQSNALPSPESVDSGYGDHNEGMWSASGRAATSSYHGQHYHPFQQQTPSYPSMQNILNYEKMGHGVISDHGDHNGTFYSSPEYQYDSYHGLNEEHDAYYNYNSRSSTSDYHALLSPSESFGDRIPPVCFPSHHEKAEHRQRHAVYLSQSLQRRSNFPQNTDVFDNGESELGISAREAQSVLTEIGSYHPHTITSYERMREHHPIVPLQHDVKSIVSVQNLTGVHSYEAGHSLPRQNCKRILEKAHVYEDSHIHFAPSQIFNMPSDKYDSRSRVNVSPEISNRQPAVYSQEQIDLANRASSSHQHPSDYVMANGLQYVSVSPSIESNQSQYSNRSYSLPKTPTPAPNVDYFDSLMPGLNNNKIPSKQVSDEIQLYHGPISNIKVENTSNRSRSYHLYVNKGCANTSSRNSHVHPQANPIIPIQDLTGYTGNGPIQLWQFLLELLCDPSYQNLITWTGENWQFKMIDPDEVARGWGIRKNKPKMTYEKLSRGIRYYYDKNIIVKCTGRRYVYKFVNDLDKILGHSAIQLHKMLGITPLDEESTTESNDEASKSQNQNSPKVSKSETTSKHNTSLNKDQHQAARSHVVRDAMAPTLETEQTGVLRTRSRSALPSHGPSTSPSIREACDKQSIQRQFSLPAGSTHYPTTPLSPNESETGLKRMSFQTNIVMSEYLPKKSYTGTSNENNSSIISTLTSSTSL